MSIQTTRTVRFETLSRRGKSAETVIKLMMACNDLQIANESLQRWRNDTSLPSTKRSAAGMYFVRMQLSHFYEGMSAIKAVQNDATLMELLESCDSQTIASFRSLTKFLSGGALHDRLEQLVGRMRSHIAFHYDETGKLIRRVLAERSTSTSTSSITRGSDMSKWHFKVASDVVDDMVVHHIWRIPRTKASAANADAVVSEIHEVFLEFVDFCGEFIWKYTDT